MTSETKVQALFQYIHRCRQVYDVVVEERRQKLKKGVSLLAQDILAGPSMFAKKKEIVGKPAAASPSKRKNEDSSRSRGQKQTSANKNSDAGAKEIEFYQIYTFD